MRAREAGKLALDILFPKRCPWCDKVIGFSEHDDCGKALAELRIEDGPVAVAPEAGGYLEQVHACYRYEPPVSSAIKRFKLEGERGLVDELGRQLAEGFAAAGRFDLILPVPVSPGTRRRRGYNQSALLAGVLSGTCGLPWQDGVLLKIKETRRQMDLSREERLTNVQGAYEVAHPAAVAGKRLLLVDDVLTTGATLNECARTLLEAGAQGCGALCLASA